ncbi:MAG: GLUG motif-containing protein [Oscillospiraceae bacterium]|nr:hypothetical protein [Oscillospiraceae bacterium]MDD7279231.1 GLUG motif-containing protein [Oscillospiraceae bacterium]MDY2863059.1 GLUG motif-containing protein [Oscillospiraceae bacterium]
MEISSNNFSIQEYTLPSLKSFNKAQKVKINVYNFSVDGNDDWDEYTPITTAEELQNINRTALSGNYVLMKDINVAEELNSKYNNWKPIGNYTSPFTGKFSGEGHIVSKINISNSSDYQGLFGYSTGVIKDVGVEDSSISGSNCVGGVCGLNTGIIERCYNTSYIHSSGENAGGICGSSSGADAKIQNCYNTGNVNGDYSGGICGNNSIGMISDCYSTGKISGRTFQGSICGFNSFDSSNYPNVKNCYYSKDICKLGGINNSDETEQAEGISTEELCNITSLSGFDTDIWENGSVTVNGNFRESIFPRLKNVGKQNEVYKDYNFDVGGQDNWETYTPIYTAEALQNINNDLSGNYVLMNDIDVVKETNKTENNWTPLGPIRVFYGKFSGDGHVVSGININMPNRDTQGLFGNFTGVIKNVGVENNSIIGSAMVGGICGYNRGKIENCYNTGDIKATFSDAGGICGHSNGEIYNCYNTGTISGDGYAGGICGNIGENLIHFCYNAGKVSGSTAIGGICGRIYNVGTVSNCYYSNEICSVGGINGNDISGQAEGISTDELCDIISHNFDSSVWANGTVTESENGVFRETVVKLPYLKM